MERFQRITSVSARVMLGSLFVVIGFNGLLRFARMPEPTLEGGAFLAALYATGYMIPLIKCTEIIAGFMLFFRPASALALVVLAPIVINIVAFHTILDPGGVPMAMTVLALALYAAWHERAAYRGLFARGDEAQPAGGGKLWTRLRPRSLAL